MKTLIRITGYVMNANVFEQHRKYGYEKPKYELYMMPDNPNELYTIEDRVEQLKREHELLKPQVFTSRDSANSPKLPDRIIYGSEMKFESLHAPKLEGELSDLTHDYELEHKYVQVVGHIQIQELGNCFLSFHIVESAAHPADGFDS